MEPHQLASPFKCSDEPYHFPEDHLSPLDEVKAVRLVAGIVALYEYFPAQLSLDSFDEEFVTLLKKGTLRCTSSSR